MTLEELYSVYLESAKVSIDTRKVEKGDLFFALKGSNFNGNLFAKQAVENGAIAAIIDEEEYADPEEKIYYFEDSLLTLQKLALYHRKQLTIPVIGLTGSNGKTTSKELIASVLKQKFNVLFTQGNLNNHIGVPLTLLSIKPQHQLAIIEMGANHQKEIEFLSNIAHPTIGYITNFGKAHLDGFGGIEGVIRGKSELYTYLREHKQTVLIDTDDKRQVELSNHIDSITFGSKGKYQFSLTENAQHLVGVKYHNYNIQSKLTGTYNYTNICAAVSLGLYFNIPTDLIKKGIEEYEPQNQRSQIVEKNGITLLLDTYNANPSSMELSLKNFSTFEGSKTIILGDMFELGASAEAEHQKIVTIAETLNFDSIFLLGENFYKTHNIKNYIQKFHSTTDMILYLKNTKLASRNVLLKGSRGMALERLIDFIF